ncbi:hypothetical protein Patl1_37651 [Pistacia atlantica]|nr:hypothetical protein Patl1_37651 [Pistacia atlantica]
MGFVPKPQHRCPIPVADDPNRIVIPKERTPDEIIKNLTYIMEEVFVNNGSHSFPLFGGNQSWSQREESFKLNSTMKVHCGFMRNGGAEMSSLDVKYVKKCRIHLMMSREGNGKVPKILTHRLFLKPQYSIWIDGKMELIVDPLLLLEKVEKHLDFIN